jgi:hypothetical protein
VRIFPLARKDAPPATRIILEEGRPFDSDWPKDGRYFDWMAQALSYEAVQPQDGTMLGMLKPLGIEPGKAFSPDARVRKILDRAAITGAAMVANGVFANRFAGSRIWPGHHWERIFFATSSNFMDGDREEIDARAGWYQLIGNSPFFYSGVALPPGAGIFYANTYRDGAGDFLDGSRTYQLTIPPDPPARQFWSLTVYDVRTRSQIDTDQQRAAVSTYSDLVKNPDGSINVYFGPTAPHDHLANWIKTIPGQGFFAMFRLYGPEAPFYNKTWVLPDLEQKL